MTIPAAALRRLNVLSAMLLAVAIAVYVWPVSVRRSSKTTPGAAMVSIPSPTPTKTADAQAVITANLLSASRRAPERRYVSPDVAAATEFAMPPAFAPPPTLSATDSTSDSEAGAEESVPALFGIVSLNGSPRALLRLSAGDANPALFGEGDKRGAFRVISIRAGSVVLAGPSGSRTLRLARPARGDSIGKTP